MVLTIEEKKEKLRIYSRQYRIDNKEKIKESAMKYRNENRENIKDKRDNNKEKLSNYYKGYSLKNKEKLSIYNKQYNEDNIIHCKKLRCKLRWNDRGVIFDNFDTMYLRYINCINCEWCNTKLNKSHILEHNHFSGEIRGIVCNSCNQLQRYRDDKYQSIMIYLRERA